MQTELLQINKHIFESNEINGNQYNYFFFDSIISNGIGEFYISQHSITKEIKSVLLLWNQQQNVVNKFVNTKEIEMKEKQASLASQLMHDVQAIIDLSENTDKNGQLVKRIEYQKKVNKNYLFWIRDCELLKSDVAIRDLINSSLQIIGIEANLLDLDITSKVNNISVDVELFSMALNEVVLNAITAVKNDLSKIRIAVLQTPSISPFIKQGWTIIEIRDTGPGIPEDFLSFVMNPFFTTRKKEGATGFGLPIAKKIIEAHQGCIELKSAAGMGTIVKLIIPG
jgi:signal transduction histidine kinase